MHWTRHYQFHREDDPISLQFLSVVDLTRAGVIHELVSRHVYILDGCTHNYQSMLYIGSSYVSTSSACSYHTHCSPYQCLSLEQKLSNYYTILEKNFTIYMYPSTTTLQRGHKNPTQHFCFLFVFNFDGCNLIGSSPVLDDMYVNHKSRLHKKIVFSLCLSESDKN